MVSNKEKVMNRVKENLKTYYMKFPVKWLDFSINVDWDKMFEVQQMTDSRYCWCINPEIEGRNAAVGGLSIPYKFCTKCKKERK